MPSADSAAPPAFRTCDLMGMRLASIDKSGVLEHIFTSLAAGIGGWLVTANLDFLRRHVRDAKARRLYATADLCVADGMPLVWAARVQGDRLPERVAGSDLIWLLVERAAREQRSVYLLGGEPAANTEAARVLRERWPSLTICGNSSPMVSSPPTADQITALREEMQRTKPDLLFVGLGSPKQEEVIQALREVLPRSWLVGVGVSFSFISGHVRRAPAWMRRTGLEWISRLVQEPRRLAHRYLVDDLPFFFELFGQILVQRIRK